MLSLKCSLLSYEVMASLYLSFFLVCSFSLCGKVSIDKIPEGLSQVPSKRKLIIFPEGKGSEAVSRETNKDGTFCTTVKPGKHVVRVNTLNS